MDLVHLTKLEEIHYPVEAPFFGPDGMDEEWVDVCETCNETSDQYAVLWPCETMQDAYHEYEQCN